MLVLWLAWEFIGSDTGLVRIAGLTSETAALEKRERELTVRARAAERRRSNLEKDPLLEERIARERFHLVKPGEIVYRYEDKTGDTLR